MFQEKIILVVNTMFLTKLLIFEINIGMLILLSVRKNILLIFRNMFEVYSN